MYRITVESDDGSPTFTFEADICFFEEQRPVLHTLSGPDGRAIEHIQSSTVYLKLNASRCVQA